MGKSNSCFLVVGAGTGGRVMDIEEYAEQTIVKLREANLLLNKIYEKDSFAREVQDDISEIMDTLRYRYLSQEEEI